MTSAKKILNFKSKNKRLADNKDSFKDWLSILKDIFDIVWRIAPPLSLACAGSFLWIYLKHIHWSGLFYESAMTGTGLIFLVLVAFVFSTISLFIFSTPSILMGITLSYFDKKQKISKEVFMIYLISLTSWVSSIYISSFLNDIHTWIFLFPIIFTSIYGCINSKKLGNSNLSTNTKKYQIANTFAVIIMSNLAMFGVIFPIIFFSGIMSHYAENSDSKEINNAIKLILIPLLTLSPGVMYLTLRKINTGIHNPLKVLTSISIMIVYLTFFLTLTFTPTSKILLESTEIYSNNKKEFQVLQQELKEIIKHTNIEKKLDGDLLTISAYVRYSFAGTKLICNEPLEFIDFSNSISKKKNKIEKSATLSCIATAAGDLREFRN